jgi:hypothetical protein
MGRPTSATIVHEDTPTRVSSRLYRRLTSLTAARVVLCGLVAIQIAFALVMDGPITGDDHYALWTAHSMWAGDVLNRDVFDPGTPLQTLLSYLGQLASGHRPFSEGLIAATFHVAGVVLTYFMARGATGSRWSAFAIATIVAVLLLPTGVYASDRMVIYPTAILLAWRYLDNPGTRSMIPLGLITAIAFLFRHDHGVFIGIPLFLAILWTRRSPLPFLLAAFLLVAPWLVWVQSTEGLVTYFTTRLHFSTALGLADTRPGFGFALDTLLTPDNELRVLWQGAVIATLGALVAAVWRKDARIAVLALTAALAETGIMREIGRYPELAAMWLPLGAWLLSRPRRSIAVPLSIAAMILVGGSAIAATNAYREIRQIVRQGGGLRHRLAESVRLQSIYPPIDLYAPRGSQDDRLLVRYVHECLDPQDRVWETSIWFSLPYESERRLVEHPYWMKGFRRELDAEFAKALPSKGFPPLIVTRYMNDPLDAFKDYPHTRALVAREYEPIVSPRLAEFRAKVIDVQLLKHKDRQATGVFEPLDLPCLRRTSQ